MRYGYEMKVYAMMVNNYIIINKKTIISDLKITDRNKDQEI